MTQPAHPKVECAFDKMISIEELIPNPRNPNKHPERQIELLAKIMRVQGVRSPIVVSNRSGFITKGHGRLEAAKLNGWTEYPVDYQDYESEAKEYADMVADNKIAELAESDMSMVIEDARRLKDQIEDFDLLGIPEFRLPEDEPIDDFYSRKIEPPIYEVTGERPNLSELLDATKTSDLTNKIEKSSVPKEVKNFLTTAAQRHNIFNYTKIAEFYAHADKETQQLMEESALVIIDFKKAIENGFIEMSEEIAQHYE